MALTRGDLAPDFEAPGVLGGERSTYRLEDHRGRPVVLVFYPGDNTPVCTRQLRSYTADMDQFVDLDAQILAVSPDDLDSHEAFSEAQGGFGFPLLSDTDKKIAADYGVLGPLGFYRRSVFVVDATGRVSYVHRGFAGATFRKTPELIAAVAGS
jgi:peroxiredoxin